MNRKAWIMCKIGLAMAIVLVGLTGGCASQGQVAGYQFGSDEVYPEGIGSVSVPIFANRTFYRGVEFDLTEALIKELELRTPYKVAREGVADTALTGTIVGVNQNLLSRTATGNLPQEVQVTVIVNYEWKDLRTGEVIRKRGAVRGTGQYVPSRPVGEFFEVAQHGAVSEVAREVVSTLREDW